MSYPVGMAEPTKEELQATWDREVQVIIDRAAAMGETLTPKEAGQRLTNAIKIKTENPDWKSPDERLDAVEVLAANLADRVAHLEEIGGGVVVGEGQ